MTDPDQPGPPDPPGPSEDGPPGVADPETGPSHHASSSRTLILGITVTFVVLLAAGVMAVLGVSADQEAAEDVRPPTVENGDQPTLADRVAPTDRAPLPDMELDAFPGHRQITTGDYRGTPVIVNFWGSWCPPCVEEMPDFQEVADVGAGRVAMLGVNIQDIEENAVALVDSLGITYDLAVDPDGELFREVEGFGMPTTLFVDPEGEIRYRYTGPIDAETLTDLLEEHLDVEVSVS